jgi:hypothetical protein
MDEAKDNKGYEMDVRCYRCCCVYESFAVVRFCAAVVASWRSAQRLFDQLCCR